MRKYYLVLLLTCPLWAENFQTNQPGTSIPVQTWTKVAAMGHTAMRLAYEGTFYADVIDRIPMLGAFAESGSEPNNAWNSYSRQENRWDNMTTGGMGMSHYFTDAGHSVAMWNYSSLDNFILIEAGNSGSNAAEHTFRNYRFDPLAMTGHENAALLKAMPNGAGNVGQYNVCYDKFRNKFYEIPNGNVDLMTYDPVLNTWATTTTTGNPFVPNYADAFGDCFYDSSDHNIYFYTEDVPTTLSNSMTSGSTTMTVGQCYSLINGSEAAIETDGTNPGEVVLVTSGGGVNGSCTVNITRGQEGTSAVAHNPGFGIAVSTLFQLNPGTLIWTPIQTTGGPPPGRAWAGMAYSTQDNVALLAGGNDLLDLCAGNSSLCKNDTWVLDLNQSPPAWTQLCGPCNAWQPVTGYTHIGNTLAYVPSANAFVYITNGNGSTDYQTAGGAPITFGQFPPAVWHYCYSACTNVGALAASLPSYSPTPGSQNRNRGSGPSVAMMPSLASNGSTLYAGWSESGQDFSPLNLGLMHVYVQSGTLGNLASLGSDYTKVDGGDVTDAEFPVVTVTSTPVPWACFELNRPGSPAVFPQGNCVQWNGSAWNTNAIDQVNGNIGKNTNGVYQFRFTMTSITTTPYVCYVESIFATSNTDDERTYCRSFNGASWVLVGGTCLNQTIGAGGTCTVRSGSTQTKVGYVSVTNNGTNPLACWTERNETFPKTINQRDSLYCSQFGGATWTNLGGQINAANTWAQIGTQSVAYSSQPYVVDTERVDGSNIAGGVGCQTGAACGVPQVMFRTWNGFSWSTLCGGALNKNTVNGWPTNPIAMADGSGNIWLLWEEQAGSYVASGYESTATGEPTRLYAVQYNISGNTCTAAGGALNADSAYGSAQYATGTVASGTPVAMWTEASIAPTNISGQVSSTAGTFGNLRQVYYKSWNGTDWVAPGCNITPASLASGQVGIPYSVTLTATGCGSNTLTWTITAGSLPTGLSGCNSVTGTTCTISGTPTTTAGSPFAFTVQVTDGGTNTATQAYSVAILPAPVGGGVFSGAVSGGGVVTH